MADDKAGPLTQALDGGSPECEPPRSPHCRCCVRYPVCAHVIDMLEIVEKIKPPPGYGHSTGTVNLAAQDEAFSAAYTGLAMACWFFRDKEPARPAYPGEPGNQGASHEA